FILERNWTHQDSRIRAVLTSRNLARVALAMSEFVASPTSWRALQVETCATTARLIRCGCIYFFRRRTFPLFTAERVFTINLLAMDLRPAHGVLRHERQLLCSLQRA